MLHSRAVKLICRPLKLLVITLSLSFSLADSRLTRKTPPSYGDGVYTMNGERRPSPRTLSQAFMKGDDGMGSLKNRTALATFFGKIWIQIFYYMNL